MGPRRRALVNRVAIVALGVAVATFVASGWEAGWPNDRYPMQWWAAAIGVPAFLVGAVGSFVGSLGQSRPPQGEETD